MSDAKIAADLGKGFVAMLHLNGLILKTMVIRGAITEEEAAALVADAAGLIPADNLLHPAFDELLNQFPR